MQTWRNKSTILQISGFEEMLEKLQKAGKNVDFETEKCFSQCCQAVTESLRDNAKSAGLSQRLIGKIEREKWHRGNKFYFAVGWAKSAPSKGNPIPDVYKVLFYNYGTPSRTTKAGYNRGQESKHPIGSRGFIRLAKKDAAKKTKKIQRDYLDDVLKDLK